MLDRVDAEAIDVEVLDPVAVDVDEALHHGGVFGEKIVEAGEVAVEGVLALEAAVAAVVVVDGVVEPRGVFGIGLGRRDDRLVRETARGGEGREQGGGVEAVVGHGPDVEGAARGVAVGSLGEGDVVVVRPLVFDDVARVVDDDVEVNLETPLVRLRDELLKISVGAQVGVDVPEIENPVAVVAGGAVGEGLIAHGRGEPEGGDTEALDVVEPGDQPGQVAAVVEADAGGIETVLFRTPGEAAGIVGRAAVGEAIGDDEIDHLPGAGMSVARHADQRHLVRPGRGGAGGDKEEGGDDQEPSPAGENRGKGGQDARLEYRANQGRGRHAAGG